MFGNRTKVEPDPTELDGDSSPTGRRDTPETLLDACVEEEVGPRCTTVRLVYDADMDVDMRHRASLVPTSASAGITTGDLVVKRQTCLWPVFYKPSAHCTDFAMEARFARSRYMHFKGAFVQVSFCMAICAVVLAVYDITNGGRWERPSILVGVVMPMYASYGIFVMKREKRYIRASGTMTEKIIIFMLTLQSAAICCSEWFRDARTDYGMLVIHIGFVHNFTPLGASAMHVVTTVFGLIPYLLLKIFRDGPGDAGIVDGECTTTEGLAKFILELLVPCGLLIYQVVVTTRRDESLRNDLVSSELLRMQKRQFQEERTKCEDLLMSMLPRQIIGQLKNNEAIAAQAFNEVTVIFVEICDFSHLCDRLKPQDVVQVLNIIYLEFDRLSDLLHVYKVETVGQVYMAVVGCPTPVENHADVAAHFALAAQRVMVRLRPRLARIDMPSATPAPPPVKPPSLDQIVSGAQAPAPVANAAKGEGMEAPRVCIRVGLNSGKIRAGVVGLDCPRFKLFGDTVNTASRMESTCLPGRVQASEATRERLTNNVFVTEDRGEVQVKGKGAMRTAFVNGYVDETFPLQPRDVQIVWRKSDKRSERSQAQQEDVDVALTDEEQCPFPAVSSVGAHPKAPSSMALASLEDAGFDEGIRHLENEERDSSTGALPPTHGTSAMTIIGHQILPAVTSAMRPQSWYLDLGIGAVFGAGEDDTTRSSRHGRLRPGAIGIQSFLDRLFLLVPPAQKQPEWLHKLRDDKTRYVQLTVSSRIASARNITITWLLIVACVSIIDYRLDVLDEDHERYRNAIIFRTLGNKIVGLIYLLMLTSPELFLLFAQRLTILMLVAQGLALVATSIIIYNSEVAIIAMYGAYVLFYTVCTMTQRMTVCCLAVIGYIVTELIRCDLPGVTTAIANIAFLCVFFLSSACAVRLEEHLAHVSHYEQRRVVKQLETINKTRSTGNLLLLSLLPGHVVERVSAGVSPIAEFHSDVTVIFTDMKGYTAYCKNLPPQELVDFLNSMYSAFDEIIANWGLHKVEVIGDAYFISAGCPPPSDAEGQTTREEWAMRAVEVALALQRSLPSVCDDPQVQMRIGIHTGSVVAGVVGKKGPRYHLFGPSVHYAEAMESHGVPGKVQISDATHGLLVNYDYQFEERSITIDSVQARTWLVHKGNNKLAFQIQKRLMLARRHSTRDSSAPS